MRKISALSFKTHFAEDQMNVKGVNIFYFKLFDDILRKYREGKLIDSKLQRKYTKVNQSNL